MSNLAQLERDLEAKKQEGLALVATTTTAAEKEDRIITDEERAAIQAITDQGLALKDKIARLRGLDAVNLQLQQLTAGASTRPAARVAKTLGQQWVESAAMEFFKQGGHRTSAARRSPSQGLFLGATSTEDPASGGALVLPDQQAGILQPFTRRLVVADLFAPGTTDSNSISYMQETLFTNAAAAVLEGGLKPESALTFAPVTDAVRKIAHWLPVTEEMLEDVAQIRSYIDARLRLGAQLAEEQELMNGDGAAPHLLGITKRPGLAPAVARGAAENNADAIFRQIMAIYGTSFLMPDGIVMNPADWAVTALMKTTTGEYLTGGPFSGIQTPTLWGLSIAVTPVQVAATAFVGAYKQGAQIFRHGGIRVEASNSHADYFIKNLVAIRAEERLALAVYRPSAFGPVTGLGVPVAP